MLGREALRGRWKLGLGAFVLYGVALYVPYGILVTLFANTPFISSVYSLLVSGPLTLGLAIFVLRLFRNDEPGAFQIFYGFERFGKSLGMYLLICLFIFLWYLIVIPGLIIASIKPFFMPFVLLLAAPAIIAAIRYSQAFFILADHPETGAMECISISKRIMAGNKWKYAKLLLSFIGWAIIASIPLSAVGGITATRVLGNMTMEIGASMNQMQIYEKFMSALLSPGTLALMYIASVGYLVLYVYVMSTLAAFYEMASGNLRPGYVASTAEIVDESHPKNIDNIE